MLKQKLFFKSIIIFIAIFILLGSFNFVLATSVDEAELGRLLSQERITRNLSGLNFNLQLYQAARAKASDMIANDYFDHYSPSGKSPWDFILATDYDYKIAGENLAMDFNTSEALHSAWMASRTHRENILNARYEDFAIVKMDGELAGEITTVVVEMFGKQDTTLGGKVNGFFTSVANYLLGYQNFFK